MKRKSDLPDYDSVRKGSRKTTIEKRRNMRLYILTGIIFAGGILAMFFLDSLRQILPDQFYLIPFVILAFVLIWGFFLPDLIMQEVLNAVIEIPDVIRILSHIVYSYLLAWLLMEFLHQIETRESMKVLILTSALIVLLFLIVATVLIVFGLI